MRNWHYQIRGLRQHLTEDESPEAVRKAATGICGVLETFAKRLKDPPAEDTIIKNYYAWAIDDHGIEELDGFIEEMRDAGGIGDCGETPDLEWFNAVLSSLWDWCDHFNVWVELDHPETGV